MNDRLQTSVRNLRAASRAPSVSAGLALLVSIAVASPTRAAASSAASDAFAPSSRVEAARVTDEVGRVVEIPQPVNRIVSLAPSITETLFALGLGERIVGDTDFCDFPPAARAKPHVGGPLSPNLEKIAALHPDLVLATRDINRPETVHSLEQLGISVYATDPRTVDQVFASTDRLGRLLGAGETGAGAVTGLRSRLKDLATRLSGVAPTRVFVVIWQDPPISVGRDTFLADALTKAGARSVIDAKQDWPNVGLEQVVSLNPEYLIFSSDEPEQVRRQISELRGRVGWRDMQAVRHDKIIVLSEAISHPSPRLLDAIEQLARTLHPDRFAAGAGGPA